MNVKTYDLRAATHKVWVVSNVADDISSAAEFGQLTPINSRYIYPDELVGVNNRLPDSFLFNLRKAVREFNPQTDYLLLAGDNVQTVMMVAMLAVQHSFFRVLRWDRKVQSYIPIAMEGHDL